MANLGRPPGGPRTGGRQKGTPNKPTRHLMDICDEMGVDPFRELLHFVKGDWKALGYEKESYWVETGENSGYEKLYIEPQVRMQAAKEACSYIYPKRKAIEHSVDPEKPLLTGVVVDQNLITTLVDAARKKKDSGDQQGDG